MGKIYGNIIKKDISVQVNLITAAFNSWKAPKSGKVAFSLTIVGNNTSTATSVFTAALTDNLGNNIYSISASIPANTGGGGNSGMIIVDVVKDRTYTRTAARTSGSNGSVVSSFSNVAYID